MYDRLTALDVSFLEMEGPITPMHVGHLSIFEPDSLVDTDGELRLERVQRFVLARLDRIPRFRKKLMAVPLSAGRPIWVDDERFDINEHVRHYHLDHGTRDELVGFCEDLHMQLLDRAAPLWEIWFFTGLNDGRVAMVERAHHALIDGVSGVDVAMALMEVQPLNEEQVDAEIAAAPIWNPEASPSPSRLLRDSVIEELQEPVDWARAAVRAARTPLQTARKGLDMVTSATTLLGRGLLAPGSTLNEEVGRSRRLATVKRSLVELKGIKERMGGTVNDVVLTAVTGALRGLLLHRHERLPAEDYHALVPVSSRGEDQHGDLGNRVAALVAPLPVAEPDLHARFDFIRDHMRRLKEQHQADITGAFLDAGDHIPFGLVTAGTRLTKRQPAFNLVVTNIPGPPMPLYFMGSRMLEAVPIVPLGSNLTLGVAVLSYAGEVVFGIHADEHHCPDYEVFTKALGHAFDEMAEMTDQPS